VRLDSDRQARHWCVRSRKDKIRRGGDVIGAGPCPDCRSVSALKSHCHGVDRPGSSPARCQHLTSLNDRCLVSSPACTVYQYLPANMHLPRVLIGQRQGNLHCSIRSRPMHTLIPANSPPVISKCDDDCLHPELPNLATTPLQLQPIPTESGQL